MNIRLAIDQSGVRGYDAVVDRGDPNALVAETLRLIASRPDGIPKGKKPRPDFTETFGVHAHDRKITTARPLVVSPGVRGRAHVAQLGRGGSSKLPVTISNKTEASWEPNSHVIQAIWLDGSKALPIRDAPRTSMVMPYTVESGTVLSIEMPVPTPPTTGMLYLSIDVIEAGQKRLGVGPVIPVRTVL